MTITFDYFRKDTGKWYTEAHVMIDGIRPTYMGFERARKLLEAATSPGLSSHFSDSFDCLVTVHGDSGPQQMLVRGA